MQSLPRETYESARAMADAGDSRHIFSFIDPDGNVLLRMTSGEIVEKVRAGKMGLTD